MTNLCSCMLFIPTPGDTNIARKLDGINICTSRIETTTMECLRDYWMLCPSNFLEQFTSHQHRPFVYCVFTVHLNSLSIIRIHVSVIFQRQLWDHFSPPKTKANRLPRQLFTITSIKGSNWTCRTDLVLDVFDMPIPRPLCPFANTPMIATSSRAN